MVSRASHPGDAVYSQGTAFLSLAATPAPSPHQSESQEGS